MQTFLAAVAAVASGAFAAAVLRQYLDRRRPYQLAWGISLAMFMLASAALLGGGAWGWSPALFKVYYLFGAILTAPWLALGTLYLLAPRKVALGYLALLLAFTALSLGLVLAAPVSASAVATTAVPEGRHILPAGVRALAVAGNVVGTLVVVGGALASGLRLRHAPEQRPRFQGTLLIAVGVALAASGGVFAFAGRSGGLALALGLGACAMYAGFRRASQPDRRRVPVTAGPVAPPPSPEPPSPEPPSPKGTTA